MGDATKSDVNTIRVTSESLMLLVERFHEKFSPQERDAIAKVRWALDEVADGNRDA